MAEESFKNTLESREPENQNLSDLKIPHHLTKEEFVKLCKFNQTPYTFVPPPIQLCPLKVTTDDTFERLIKPIAKQYKLFGNEKVSLQQPTGDSREQDSQNMSSREQGSQNMPSMNISSKQPELQDQKIKNIKSQRPSVAEYQKIGICQVKKEMQLLVYNIYDQFKKTLQKILSEEKSEDLKEVYEGLKQKIHAFFYLCEKARRHECKWLILIRMKEQTKDIKMATEQIENTLKQMYQFIVKSAATNKKETANN